MKAPLLTLLIFSLAIGLFAQSKRPCETSSNLTINLPDGPKPYTSLELNNNPCQFQFAIVTDRTGAHRPGVFMDGVRKLNLLQPEFVMSVGDLIEGYTEDLNQLNFEWEEFDGFIDSLEMPFFYVPGNHDITNQVMEDLWKKRLGPTFYHFVYKEVLFLCLNSEDQRRGAGQGTISDEQYEYIKKVLEENKEARWTLVFMHQPLWVQKDPVRWPDVEELLEKRKHTVFVGHEHRYVRYERNNGKYFILATTGGGSSLRGPELGEFDHVVWVTMTDQGPILANLQLDGIWDENVFTEEARTFVERFRDIEPFQIEPFFVDTSAANDGAFRIRLTNDEDVPMHVRLKEGFSWDINCELSEYDVVVPPNSVSFIDGWLSARRWKRKLDEYDPIELNTQLWFEGEGIPQIKMPATFNLRPLERFSLLKTEKTIAIDADLTEWKELPYSVKTDVDIEDCSAQFDVRYDAEYLYVAAKVRDDQVLVDTGTVTFQQDFVGPVFSAEPLAKSAMKVGRSWFNESFIYIMSPETADTPSTTFYDERLPAGVKWACKANEDGYTMEIAIPVKYIEERQGKDWKSLRFNLVVQDWDEGEKEKPRFTFMPNWRGKENVVGSGMFFR